MKVFLLVLLLTWTQGIRGNVTGIDVSDFQFNVDWASVKASGDSFAYIKATDGILYENIRFNSHYTGATNVGLIRGAYHLGRMELSSGADQANFFVANGGGWTPDGKTLPGALHLEPGRVRTCHLLSQSAMVAWIRDFSNTYHSKTGRYPVIYTTTIWWQMCTGNNAGFGSNNPLWISNHGSSIGPLPAGWAFATFWQFLDLNPGNLDWFIGDQSGLERFAQG